MGKKEIVQRSEVVFEPEEDGGYHVYVPALKGCHSHGATREEARRNIGEAMQLWLESAKELIAVPDRTEHEKV
jgi:predicted RNase H-like HicB family nuclease